MQVQPQAGVKQKRLKKAEKLALKRKLRSQPKPEPVALTFNLKEAEELKFGEDFVRMPIETKEMIAGEHGNMPSFD